MIMNMDFENSIIYALTQVSVAYRSYLEKAMNTVGLHSGQVFVLISLWKVNGQSQIDLVKNLNLTAPTVHKMLKSLSARGFVECRKCSKDNRMMQVFLTEKGVRCEISVAEQWNKIESLFYSNLTETEKLVFTQLIGKMRENLNLNTITLGAKD